MDFTHWRVLVVEILSIIMGVLIALAMSDWNEDRQNQNRAELALDIIHQELSNHLLIPNIIQLNNTL